MAIMMIRSKQIQKVIHMDPKIIGV